MTSVQEAPTSLKAPLFHLRNPDSDQRGSVIPAQAVDARLSLQLHLRGDAEGQAGSEMESRGMDSATWPKAIEPPPWMDRDMGVWGV